MRLHCPAGPTNYLYEQDGVPKAAEGSDLHVNY